MGSVTTRRHVGEACAALAAMGFGSAYVATGVVLDAFEPVPAAAWRSLLATLAVGVLVAADRRRTRAPVGARGATAPAQVPLASAGARASAGPRPAARVARLLALAALAGPVFLASMNLAVDHVGAAIAAFVAGLYAVLSAVIAPALLPERLAARALAGFLLALAGTALLAELDPVATDLEGMAWGLLAAGSFALYLVLARRWSVPYRLDGRTVAMVNGACTAGVLGAVVIATDPALLVPPAPPSAAWVAMGWLAAVAALGPILTVASVRRIPASRSAAFLLLNPVTALVLAVLLLGERPSLLQLGGAALVLAGIAAATIRPGRQPTPSPSSARRSAGSDR